MARKIRIAERTTDLPSCEAPDIGPQQRYSPHDANLGSLIQIMLIAIKAVGFPSSACCGFARPVRGLLVYCADYRRSHSIAISGDAWPDDARLSDIEPGLSAKPAGKRGADVRPDFNWERQPVEIM